MKASIVALAVASSFLMSTGAFAQALPNGAKKGPQSFDATGAIPATHGQVWYTAAINSDGSVAGCLNCNRTNTIHLGTGLYQVGFAGNVTAAAGFSRWVQADTLQVGSEVAFCNTADRSGLATAVFINCNNVSGPVDVSFFLFVAR